MIGRDTSLQLLSQQLLEQLCVAGEKVRGLHGSESPLTHTLKAPVPFEPCDDGWLNWLGGSKSDCAHTLGNNSRYLDRRCAQTSNI